MSTQPDPKREHPSTYVVSDRSNEEERLRVSLQDQLVTTGMGGVLPEQANPAIFDRVLDIGCGTGDWVIQTALAYPKMSQLVGIDVSAKMIGFARQGAEEAQIAHRVQFQVGDALRMLEFPDYSFDLINQRFGQSYLRTWDWPKQLLEYQRVCKPGGVIRVTEAEGIQSSSPALSQLSQLLLAAFFQAGHFFTETYDGVTSELESLLSRQGLQDVQTRQYALNYQAGTNQGQHFAEDMTRLYRTIVPFLRKWTRVPSDYEEIYQQMLTEIHQPDFKATWKIQTAYGKVPQTH